MKLTLHVVGRMKSGPETELFSRYFERAKSLAKSQGVQNISLIEYSESKAKRSDDRKVQEAQAILEKLDKRDAVIVLDEGGKTITSHGFAELITDNRDNVGADVAFVIGGADGLDHILKQRALRKVSFGAMTMPHQLVRVLLSEQIYRALSIMAGHPYHRV